MKSIQINLKGSKIKEYKLAADKLELTLEQYVELILDKISITKLDINSTPEDAKNPILNQEDYESLKEEILSDYAELYKRLA